MARSPFTLAALATAAVAGLDVAGAERFGSPSPARFDKATLQLRDGGRAIIRVPRMKSAETEATADVAALRALTAGVRSRLPFAVPTVLGEAPALGTRAVVLDYLPGTVLALEELRSGGSLAASVGRSVAALHTLPTSLVTDAALPVSRPVDALAGTVAVMEQATSTGLVPAALIDRWEHASDDQGLWQFAPTVVNGAMSAETLLHDGDRVTGVVDWFALGVGDPARDLFWVLGATGPEAADSVFDAYNGAMDSNDRQVKKRATLYAELEIAKWLLHGTRQKSTEIVDDAVGMLHNLVDIVQNDLNRSIDTNTRPVMTVSEVEDMLDRDARGESRTPPGIGAR